MSQEPTNDDAARRIQRRLLIGLTIAILVWGGFLAIGSFLGGVNLRGGAGRGLVIFGCVSFFLAFWWMLLLMRKQQGPHDRA
ncbi:MAG: hypothetical protein IT427_07300 [Pirellulales bacterium]|nr:hypothetical protein [Pirellulales bacterium]